MAENIVITGGAGFIGHHVVDHVLRTTDSTITVLDRLDCSGCINRLTDLDVWGQEGHRVKFVYCDLRSPINDLTAAQIGKADVILHLAASTHVDRSITHPQEFVADNVMGTTNLLWWARSVAPRLFVNFSTDEVYGPAPVGYDYKEDDPKHPKNPYAAAKTGQEAMGEAFANTYRMNVVGTHTMNVFGERQHPEKFIPLVIRRVLQGETVSIHAHPDKQRAGTRFYIHARQVAEALSFLMRQPYTGYQEFNIVGEEEVDNLSLALLIADTIGKPLHYEMVDFHTSRPGHDLRYGLDGAKMRGLGWQPTNTFRESLAQTVAWYLDNPAWLGV